MQKSTKICAICDDSFTPNSNRQKYCSPTCKDVAQRENKQRWNEENRDYKAEFSRQYRKGKRAEKQQKLKERSKVIKKIIENETGGKFR